MHQRNFNDIEKSIEKVSPVDALVDCGIHSGVHATITKFLLVISVSLFALSFIFPSFGNLAFTVFCTAIPVSLLGEAFASIRSGELRVSLRRRRFIANIDFVEHKLPRVVIRRNERPFRFWLYQLLLFFFGLSPLLITGFVLYRS